MEDNVESSTFTAQHILKAFGTLKHNEITSCINTNQPSIPFHSNLKQAGRPSSNLTPVHNELHYTC